MNVDVLFSALPLGQSNLDAIGKNWGETTISVGWTLLAVGVLVAAVSGVAAIGWWRRRHQRSKPLAVFHELASIGGLSLTDQWLLWRIARQQGLPSALTLLLSPQTLRIHGSAYARQRSVLYRATRMRRIAAIRHKLLGRPVSR